MKKNKIFSVLFSLALVFTLGFSAMSFPTTASAKVEDKWEGKLEASDGEDDDSVYVTAGYGHVKLQLQNKGKSSATITLTQKDTGVEYLSVTLDPGETYDWKSNDKYSKGIGAGKYILAGVSGNKALNVEYYGKTSDKKW